MLHLRHTVVSLLCVIALSINAQLNTDRITSIGRSALYFDDYVLSIQYFNQVIKIKPYLSEPYLLRAIAKTQLGDYLSAELDCNRAIELNPFMPGAYYTRGYIRSQQHRYADAENDISQALIFAPENKTYMLIRADIRIAAENYDGALDDINTLLRHDKKDSRLYLERGRIHWHQGDTLKTLEDFTAAIENDPHGISGWSARGMVHTAMENNAQAIEDLTRAIELGSKWQGDYMNRGLLYYKAHNYRGALADYDKAVEYGSDDYACYYNRGLLRQEVGDYNRALDDYDKSLQLHPTPEAYYQHGMVNMQLRQWNDARADFDTLIAAHPYFLPAYYLAAQATDKMGLRSDSKNYLRQAYQLEKNEDIIRKKQAQLQVDAKIADTEEQQKDWRKEFSAQAAENATESTDNKYDSALRGTVQNKNSKVINQPMFVVSFYSKTDNLRRTTTYHPALERYNRTHNNSSPLKMTCEEMPLNADMISLHFSRIESLTNVINNYNGSDNSSLADWHFQRAVEFATVQDYSSAIEDVNQAVAYGIEGVLPYFCRATWRYRRLETERDNTNYRLEYELIMRDLDYVIRICPDFTFAYYNKANLLCLQKDYTAAINFYEQAINFDNEMAEAYFNKGLTEIFIQQNKKGVASLSRAGELGIYQAYNLITRFK